MSLLKLSPSYKDYIWGGHRLVEEYHKKYEGDILAESWELSCHPDGPSYLAEGSEKGLTLTEYIQAHGRDVLGTNCKRFADFPILIKFIDARGNLSIQVHPDNAYAREHENQFGKTEMWYIMDAAPGAFLYYGFDHTISREEMEQRIRENTLLEVLHKEPVKKGDVLFIPSGTIHAICENIVIAGDPAELERDLSRLRLRPTGRRRKAACASCAEGTGCNKKRTCRSGSSLCPPSCD